MVTSPRDFQLIRYLRPFIRTPWISLFIAVLVTGGLLAIFHYARLVPPTFVWVMSLQILGMLSAIFVVWHGAEWFLRWQLDIPAFIDPIDADAIPAWVETRNRTFRASHKATITAVITTTLAIGAYILAWRGEIKEYPTLPLAITIFMIPTGYVAGLCIAVLCHFCRFIAALGRFGIINEDYITGVRSTGRVLVMIYTLATLPWLCYTASALPLPESTLPMLLLAFPAVVFYASSFAGCQVPLHRRMVEYKKERITEYAAQLRELEPSSPDELTEERSRIIDYYQEKLNQACYLPEWPFNYKQMTTICLSACAAFGIPLLTALVTIWPKEQP